MSVRTREQKHFKMFIRQSIPLRSQCLAPDAK